jgi:hypothetical protein
LAPQLSFGKKSSGQILVHLYGNKAQFLPEEFLDKFPKNVKSLRPTLGLKRKIDPEAIQTSYYFSYFYNPFLTQVHQPS